MLLLKLRYFAYKYRRWNFEENFNIESLTLGHSFQLNGFLFKRIRGARAKAFSANASGKKVQLSPEHYTNTNDNMETICLMMVADMEPFVNFQKHTRFSLCGCHSKNVITTSSAHSYLSRKRYLVTVKSFWGWRSRDNVIMQWLYVNRWTQTRWYRFIVGQRQSCKGKR